jgi:hypothetical protein
MHLVLMIEITVRDHLYSVSSSSFRYAVGRLICYLGPLLAISPLNVWYLERAVIFPMG